MKALICIAIWIILTWIVPTAVIRTDRLPRGTRGIALAPLLGVSKKERTTDNGEARDDTRGAVQKIRLARILPDLLLPPLHERIQTQPT